MNATASPNFDLRLDYGFPFRLFRGHAFAMLTMCFDGSGKEDDPGSQFVTLAGFAADDAAWDHLNHHWEMALTQHGVKHLHMVDLIAGNDPYVGWSQADIEFLMQKLSLVPSYIAKDFRIQGARFSIEATAHRQWSSVSNACPISENLALGCFYRLFQWYAQSPKAILDPMVLLYDRSEPYLNHMMQRCNRRSSASRREKPWWHLISSIAPVDGKKVYGVQAADMLAWSYNRIRARGKTDFPGRIAELVISRVPHLFNEVEESDFRKVKLIGEIL